MKELHALKMVEQKSRFMCHLYSIQSRNEVEDILKQHRSNYRKANHHCFALRIKYDNGGEVHSEFRNDGEVGHPGKVLLELLEKFDLCTHAIVVSRIFGGIKLGGGGVSRAFRDVGDETLSQWTSERGSGSNFSSFLE